MFDSRNFDITNMSTQGRQGPASLRALQRVGPYEVPYSDEERAFAAAQQGDDLQARERDWRESTYGAASPSLGFGPASPSPLMESRVFQQMSPAWASFADAMHQNERLAGNRGMNSRVNLQSIGALGRM